MLFRPGDRVVAIFDQPANFPMEIHVVRGGVYEIAAYETEHGFVKLAGDQPSRWLTGLGFALRERGVSGAVGSRQ